MAEDQDVPLTGELREELVERKQDWAQDGRLITGQTDAAHALRPPPAQALVKDWPVLNLSVQPDVAKDRFRLRVEGLVQNRVALDWDWFMAIEQREQVCDIHCVTQRSRYDNRLTGVAARTLLALARPKASAPAASVDDFTLPRLEGGELPLAQFRGQALLIANTASFCGFTPQYAGLR